MIFREGREQVGGGQLLLAGLEVQPVAERRILRHGDGRCLADIALGALDALLALFTGVALLTLRARNPLLALRPRTAPDALFTPRALRSHWPHGALNGHI